MRFGALGDERLAQGATSRYGGYAPRASPSGGRPEVRRTSGITQPPGAAGAATPVMPEVFLSPPRVRASVYIT